MARFITGVATRRIDPQDDAPEAVAERLRLEMRDAVGSLRARLPEAFPRWQQRRRDACDNTTDPR
jgi:molybdopterin converting factor small subunit